MRRRWEFSECLPTKNTIFYGLASLRFRASTNGRPAPSVPKAFDLQLGVLKASYPLATKDAFCNDIGVGEDAATYISALTTWKRIVFRVITPTVAFEHELACRRFKRLSRLVKIPLSVYRVGAAHVCLIGPVSVMEGQALEFSPRRSPKLAAQDLPIIIREARESFEGQSCALSVDQ